MNNPKISVVVPVYNVEKYLRQCIDSILNQTYDNLEIILVNDGSTDNCPEICDEYAHKDSRVKVIHKKNGGLSSARNRGIDESTGEYIMFVDSDDWINLNTCSIASATIQEYVADVVIWNYIREYSYKQSRKTTIFSEPIILFTNRELEWRLYRRFIGLIGKELSAPEKADAIVPMCTKLYRTSLIKENNIFAIDTKLIGTEDALFNISLFNYVKKAVYIKNHFYHYRRDNSSSLTSKYKPALQKQWNNLFDIMQEHIESKKLGEHFIQSLNNRIALSIIGLGFNALSSDKDMKAKYTEIRNIMKQPRFRNAVKMLEIKHMPIHWKVFFSCAKRNFVPSVFLLLLIAKKMREKI